MVTPIDPTSAAFLLAENRTLPMHVGGLQLFKKPEGAGRDYVREMYEPDARTPSEIAPLFLKHPHRSLSTAGQLVWMERRAVRHRAPRAAQRAAQAGPGPRAARPLRPGCTAPGSPGSGRCGRRTSIEGLRDGRVAMYTKTHHALVDGVSAMRLLASVLCTDPDQRDMPAPWAARPASAKAQRRPGRPPRRRCAACR